MILEDGVLDIEYEKLLMIVARRGRLVMTGKEKTYPQMRKLTDLGFVNIVNGVKTEYAVFPTQKGREYAEDNGVTTEKIIPPKKKILSKLKRRKK